MHCIHPCSQGIFCSPNSLTWKGGGGMGAHYLGTRIILVKSCDVIVLWQIPPSPQSDQFVFSCPCCGASVYRYRLFLRTASSHTTQLKGE